MLGIEGRNRREESQLTGKARLRTPLNANPPENQGPGELHGGIGQRQPDTDMDGTGQSPRERIPSPESQFGGMMNRQGQIAPPMPSPTPNPVASQVPQPNQLPMPSPRALTGQMFGNAGGLMGGGIGVAGDSEYGKSDPTELLALIASLFGR